VKKILVLLILFVNCGQSSIQLQPPAPDWVKRTEAFRQDGMVYGVGMFHGKDATLAKNNAILQAKELIRSFLKTEGVLFGWQIKAFWQDPKTGAFYTLVCCYDTSTKKN